ncbi:hypothetical protein LguiA_028172 [Lonicera macranthoides]
MKHDFSEESFTPQEDELIIRLHATIGSRWPIIAQQLPGRTDSDVKNHWNTKLRKKLSEMGIDPVTHKPFSKILADYGSIGSLSRSSTRAGSLNRELKNIIAFESQVENFSNYKTHLSVPKTEPSKESFSIDPGYTTENEEPPPHSFSWRDFLLEDAFLPENACAKEKEISKGVEETCEGVEETNECNNIPIYNSLSASTSSDSSFVEAMIDEEKDMFLEFPGLLEEPFF